MKPDLNTTPDYKAIYKDILNYKFPDKAEECLWLLDKKQLSALDILKLNKKIFGTADKQSEKASQKHRSYRKTDILQILDYQKKNKLNNVELARHFNLSRNTVAKWKKMFVV